MATETQENVVESMMRYVGPCSCMPSQHLTHSAVQRPHRMSREQRDLHSARLEKHYMAGTWYGQSAAGTIYILATVLERIDNELLWYAYIFNYIK
jgi:hypothetical protein